MRPANAEVAVYDNRLDSAIRELRKRMIPTLHSLRTRTANPKVSDRKKVKAKKALKFLRQREKRREAAAALYKKERQKRAQAAVHMTEHQVKASEAA